MKSSRPRSNRKKHQRLAPRQQQHGLTVAAMLLLSLVGSGCQSAGLNAVDLPPEYRVAAKAGKPAMALNRLSGPGASNAQIAAGDLLEWTIATGREGEEAIPGKVRVAADGTASIPPIGPVYVAGMEAFDGGTAIASAAISRGIFRNPQVTLRIEEQAVNKVTILGAVANPGVYELPRNSCDIATALGSAGGLTEEASTSVEVLRHPPRFATLASTDGSQTDPAVQQASYPPGLGSDPMWREPVQVARLDLAEERSLSEASQSLGDRDVVMVLPREKEVFHVAGLVNQPGQFELPDDQNIRLLDAVAQARGKSSPAADRVVVLRTPPGGNSPILIRTTLSEAKRSPAANLRIGAGDTVSVEETPATVIVDSLTRFMRITLGLSGGTTLF